MGHSRRLKFGTSLGRELTQSRGPMRCAFYLLLSTNSTWLIDHELLTPALNELSRRPDYIAQMRGDPSCRMVGSCTEGVPLQLRQIDVLVTMYRRKHPKVFHRVAYAQAVFEILRELSSTPSDRQQRCHCVFRSINNRAAGSSTLKRLPTAIRASRTAGNT
jgi:hypothetical protein